MDNSNTPASLALNAYLVASLQLLVPDRTRNGILDALINLSETSRVLILIMHELLTIGKMTLHIGSRPLNGMTAIETIIEYLGFKGYLDIPLMKRNSSDYFKLDHDLFSRIDEVLSKATVELALQTMWKKAYARLHKDCAADEMIAFLTFLKRDDLCQQYFPPVFGPSVSNDDA